jgi:hypothetical protein
MSGTVIRYPMRCSAVVWIIVECGAWLVLARDHGWIHGSFWGALDDARWLSENFGGLPIRMKVST